MRKPRFRRVLRAKLWALHNYWSAMRRHPGKALSFLLFDPELDNYTYQIANLDELGTFMAAAIGINAGQARAYIEELEQDTAFRAELNSRLRTRRDRKHTALYGRRAGWYCAVRALHPHLLIETGVHDGLGSSVLLRALERNRAEGHNGSLIGIDIDPRAGWLIPDRLRVHFTLKLENSITSLSRLKDEEGVDFFVHDSDHRYDYELGEYQAVARHLLSQAVVLSDNAHATEALKDFAKAEGWRFAFWHEQTKGHFYPGGGIGIARRMPGYQPLS